MMTFVVPVLWLSTQPGSTLHHVWLLLASSVIAQCALRVWLLARAFKRKLGTASDFHLSPLTDAAKMRAKAEHRP